MKARVSICVPMYNGADHLVQCLESALAQTFQDFELLLVDDGSKDNTLEIAEEFARQDSRVRLHRNPKNLGLVGNWNRCVELAQGEWVKFLFQDDFLEPACVESMLKAAADSDTRLVVCQRAFVYGAEASEARRADWEAFIAKNCLRHRFAGRSEITAELFAAQVARFPLINCIGEPTATLFQRPASKDFGVFNVHLLQLVDWEYFARLAVQTGLCYVDEALATFRVHDVSATAANSARRAYRIEMIDPMIILHDLVYSPCYAPVRLAAASANPKIDLLRRYVTTARYARWLARQQTNHPVVIDQQARNDWKDAAKFYPNILSLPPSYVISNGLRRVKEKYRRLIGSVFKIGDMP